MWQAMKTLSVALIGLAVCAGSAQAQGVVQAIGGITNQAEQHPVFAIGVGGKAGVLEVDGEFGKFLNIVPKRSFDLARQLSGGTIEARLPAWYGMGSLRLIGAMGPVQPYLNGGLGLARLQPELSATNGSTTTVLVFGSDQDENKFLMGGGGGLRFDAGRMAVDAGYKYIRIFEKYRSDTDFNNDDVLVNVHMFYVALGIKF